MTQVATFATTGPDGSYRLQRPPGLYLVEFSGTGFDPAVRTGVVVIDSSASELNVTLLKAGTTRPPESLDDVKRGEVAVRIDTPFGSIFIAVDATHAPVTAANFLKYVDGGFYTGGRFHRTVTPANQPTDSVRIQVIQGGPNPLRQGTGFAPRKLIIDS